MSRDKHEKPGSNGVIATIQWEQAIGRAGLTKAPKSLLSGILAYMDIKTYECRASIQRLAHDRDYSLPTFTNAFRSLEDIGVIIVLRRSKGGRDSRGYGISHHFRLDYPALNSLAREYRSDVPSHHLNSQTAQVNSQMAQLNGKATLYNQPQTIQSVDQSVCRAFIEKYLGLNDAEMIFKNIEWKEVGRIINATLLEYDLGRKSNNSKRIRSFPAVLRYRLLGERRGSHAGAKLGDAIDPFQAQINKLREGRGINPNRFSG